MARSPSRSEGRAPAAPPAPAGRPSEQASVLWPPVRIATWNVNSIRSRADRVAAWLERSDVDVVALQET
ncbi:MAG TPA: endonuclease/exonuclease/phosphatase family protein, partial [Blastococcus sp.]